MIKMSRAKRNDYDNLAYRFELLEKRIDTLERLLHSRPEGNITQELLQLVLGMIKQQSVVPTAQQQIAHAVPQPQQVHTETAEASSSVEKPTTEIDKSKIGFYKRISIV